MAGPAVPGPRPSALSAPADALPGAADTILLFTKDALHVLTSAKKGARPAGPAPALGQARWAARARPREARLRACAAGAFGSGGSASATNCSALQPSDTRSPAARRRHLRLALGGQQARERAEAAGAARGAVGVRRGRAGRRHRRRHLLLQQRERARGVRLVVVVLRRAVCARGAGLELGAVGGAAHSAQGFEPWARASRGPPQRLHAGLQPACCTLAPAMPAPTHTGHARGLGPRPGPRTSAAGARALGRRRLHRVQRVAQALRGPGCMGRPVQPCPLGPGRHGEWTTVSGHRPPAHRPCHCAHWESRVTSWEETHINADLCLGLGSGVPCIVGAQAVFQWNSDKHVRLAAYLSTRTAAPSSCLSMGKKGRGATRVPSGTGSTGLGGCGAGGLQDRLLYKRVEAYCLARPSSKAGGSDELCLSAKRPRTAALLLAHHVLQTSGSAR